MKTKIESYYDPILGRSYADIYRNGECYMAEVIISPEDEDVKSSFAGCYFAEYKARIKMLKGKLKEKKKAYSILENMYFNITQLREFDANRRENRFFRKQLYIKKNEIKNLQNLINYMQTNYLTVVSERLEMSRTKIPEILNAINEKKKIQEALKAECQEEG